jgi:Restriction alleviation protein Lar
MSELKPCPFCGSAAELKVDGDHHGEFFTLGCGGGERRCPGYWAFYTEPREELDASIEVWNRRAPTEREE